jgi:hypothetical protein
MQYKNQTRNNFTKDQYADQYAIKPMVLVSTTASLNL